MSAGWPIGDRAQVQMATGGTFSTGEAGSPRAVSMICAADSASSYFAGCFFTRQARARGDDLQIDSYQQTCLTALVAMHKTYTHRSIP
jgi:hypothetical protein